jgi:hypothetical protein
MASDRDDAPVAHVNRGRTNLVRQHDALASYDERGHGPGRL